MGVGVDRDTGESLEATLGAGDGRTARRDRNRVAVLDAVLALFSEDNPNPSPEQVAQRSGVSLRSVYRYVADSDDLIRSAIERHLEIVQPLFVIDDLGQGSLTHRLETFIDARLRLHEAIAPTMRASRLRAPTNAAIRRQVEFGRRVLRGQTERQFAPELDRLDAPVRAAVATAADALTQMDTIDLYRHVRRLSAKDTRQVLDVALRALLTYRP